MGSTSDGTGGAAPVNTARVFAVIAEAERTLPVDEWSIGGVRVWPIVRNYWAYDTITQHEYNPDSQIVRYAGRSRRMLQIARALGDGLAARWRDRAANGDPAAPADVVAFVPSSTRFFRVAGRWYNPYCDSFRPSLEASGLRLSTWEVTGDGAYRVPRYGPSALIQNDVFVRTLLAAWRGRGPQAGERLDGWNDFVALCDRAFGSGYAYGRDAVRFRASQVAALRAYFVAMLRRARPAVGLVTGYYSSEGMAFILACRDLGIRSVEIQHGVQGPAHFAYAKWARIPAGGFELLPEVFWTWDEPARAVIAEWAAGTSGAHTAFIGGNPCLTLPAAAGAGPAAGAGGLRILFTAQAFFGLPPTILDAMAASPDEWHWWIRIHPQYWETREPIRAALRARGLRHWSMDEASDTPMATMLAASDVHVTEFSSSVLEAEALGVPSVIVHDKGRSLFPDQVASGIARYADTGAAVVSAIRTQAALRRELRTGLADPVRRFTDGCRWLAGLVDQIRTEPAPR